MAIYQGNRHIRFCIIIVFAGVFPFSFHCDNRDQIRAHLIAFEVNKHLLTQAHCIIDKGETLASMKNAFQAMVVVGKY